jgi:hypothetical protein
MSSQLALTGVDELSTPATASETLPPMAQAKVTLMLARLLATVIEEAHDK